MMQRFSINNRPGYAEYTCPDGYTNHAAEERDVNFTASDAKNISSKSDEEVDESYT